MEEFKNMFEAGQNAIKEAGGFTDHAEPGAPSMFAHKPPRPPKFGAAPKSQYSYVRQSRREEPGGTEPEGMPFGAMEMAGHLEE